MLIENTLFGEINKIEKSIEVIKQFQPSEGYYLAFSGGKDSQVLYHLARMAEVKFDGHYMNTTIDPPELVRFIRENYPDVKEHRPEKSMFQLIPSKGFPTRYHRWCCEELKERFSKARVVLTGVRWSESNKRRKRKMVEQCYRYATKSFVHPIINWTDQDVWKFIKKLDLSYCELYDKGFKRIGCIMCPIASGKVRKYECQKYPNFERAYRIAFRKLFDRKIKEKHSSVSRWKDGDEMFDWWLSDTRTRRNEAQFRMFDSD